jgi:predicted small lipoprotein YifL
VKRNLTFLLSFIALASLILAACGGAAPATQPPAGTEPPAATEPSVPSEPVTLGGESGYLESGHCGVE